MSISNPYPNLVHSRRLSKEGLWIIFGQAMAVIGSLFGLRVLTGLMDPEAYGELSLAMTAAMLVNQTVFGPLAGGAARFYAPAQEKGNFAGYFSALQRLVLSATGIILLALLIIVAGLALAGRAGYTGITAAAFIFAILSGYSTILVGIQNSARQRSVVALRQGMEPWARFMFAAFLITLTGAAAAAAMAGYLLSALLILGTQAVFFLRITAQGRAHIPATDSKPTDWRRLLVEYSWPSATWGILLWVYLSSGRWALQFFNSTADTGYYAVLFQLGYYPFMMLAAMGVQFLSPVYFQRAGDSSDPARLYGVFKLAWRVTLLSFIGMLFITALAYFFHKPIFHLLAAPAYGQVSRFMPLLVLASGLFASSHFCAMAMQSQKTTNILLLPKNVSYVVGALFTFAGAAYSGLAGVVYAMVITNLFHFIWVALLLKREMNRLQISAANGNTYAGK